MVLRLVPCLLAAAILTGCAGREPSSAANVPRQELYAWFPTGLEGKRRVVIDLSDQRAEFLIGGQLAGWAVVATGKAGFDTPANDYRIVEKVVDKESTLYGVIVDANGAVVNSNADIRKDNVPSGGRFLHAPMPYWMRLTWTGIGMHAGPIPQPGTPASHGCIRLPSEFAPLLFGEVTIGTPVAIVR